MTGAKELAENIPEPVLTCQDVFITAMFLQRAVHVKYQFILYTF
jgi:hypothetical protein